MSAAVFVLSSLVFAGVLATVATTIAVVGFGWLWFFLPLSRRWRDRARTEQGLARSGR